MNEKKLMELIYQQRPIPTQAFDQRISRQANRLVREIKPMKKKMSALALTTIIILALALFGVVAEMLGFNIFVLFGQKDDRLKELAPSATLNEVTPFTTTSLELGEVVAGINSVYYDGESLLVGYSIENGRHIEKFTPSENMLAKMNPVDSSLAIVAENEKEAEIMKEWIAAKEKGSPIGIAHHYLSLSDSTQTDRGVDLPPKSESHLEGEKGTNHYIREYESPLPSEAQDQEYLNIEIMLYKGASYLYFDGENAYAYFESTELEPIKATVWRADAELRNFSGGGVYDGKPISIKADVSAATARITVTMEGGEFPALAEPYDSWYDVQLLDENSNSFRAEGAGEINGNQLTVSFEGTGKLPESLSLRLVVISEADDEETLKATIENAPIHPLKLVEDSN